MMYIPLTRGRRAKVDDSDYEFLMRWRWYCNAQGYAVRDTGGRKNRKVVWMHRVLNKTPAHRRTDHINRNTLDNRRANLRSVTPSVNGQNRGLNKNNTSGLKGVIWRRDTKRWQARIKVDRRTFYLGCFESLRDAAKARRLGEAKYFSV